MAQLRLRGFRAALLFACFPVFAADHGSISGTVRDPSGAVIPKALVTATNTGTGVRIIATTTGAGDYAFSSLLVGSYDLDISLAGFRSWRRTNIAVDVNSLIRVDAMLEVGPNRETITVEASAVQVDAASTQAGEVITGKNIAALPLNGRSYTDLLALQPGVTPVTTITSAALQGLGQSVFLPSGGLNPGTLSINGQRESANGFTVNGADAEEDGSMAAAIIPNLDSIAEFRILTNNYDAEYGRYTGGQINVVTKSGTNQLHADLFEFLRNTDLDARNYFSPARATFIQNQFGGAAGGPIARNKTFFFVDYQGTRQIQGQDTGLISVPSLQDRQGDLSDEASSLTGKVQGDYWARLLSQKLGYAVSTGEPYYFSGCTSPTQCVLPNATVPITAWSAPARNLLQYIPQPDLPGSLFSSSAYNQTLRDDKGGARFDANTRWGLLSAYYSADDYSRNNPYPTAQGGANVPGFNALDTGRAQLAVLSDTKPIGTNAVNEFHLSFTRDANNLGQPLGGTGVSLASQGFVTGPGTLGIVPGQQVQGVESVAFNNFTIGADPNQFAQINNTYEWLDNFSREWGSHSLKFGAQFNYAQVNTYPYAQLNGSFQFFGAETGLDFADFLLGIASQYNQNALRPFYARNKYVGLYAQDSWRVRSGFTLNYGLRWDRIEPWYEKYNNTMTLVPGQQSVVFPTAPAGIVFPGDPGISRTLAPPGNLDFAPRIGLAWVPGRSGKTSIRAGFGIFYAGIQEDTLSLISDNAPYGYTYTSPAPPLFATPFVDAATGNSVGQRFPAQLAPLNVSASNPDSSVDWSQFEPLSAIPGYAPKNRIPYTEQYMLSIQRRLGSGTLLNVSYSGNQAHHLLMLEAANPGNPALCLSLSQPGEVAPNTPTCGPFGESDTYTTASGQIVNGTRGPLGPAFGSVSYQTSIGNSNYNALQTTLRHISGRLELIAGYTYSKAIDQGSNPGDQIDPLNPSLSRALSSFDMRQDFVVSYNYRVPLDRLARTNNSWLRDWSFSGISRFSTGFPITLYNYADTSLLGTQSNGINNLPVDEPDYTPGPLELNRNPRNGLPYFNTSLFSLPPLGSIGTASRRSFSGPGIENYDMALQKNVALTESKTFQLRLEAFNVFNHAQFYGPASVNGNINSGTFGQVVSAAPPRLVQIAARLLF